MAAAAGESLSIYYHDKTERGVLSPRERRGAEGFWGLPQLPRAIGARQSHSALRTRSLERLDDTNSDRCAAESPLGARRMDILDASHVCVHENSRDRDTPASFSLRNPTAFFVLSHNLAWMLLLDRTTAPMQLALLPTRRLD